MDHHDSTRRHLAAGAALLAGALGAACATAMNYGGTAGPRYAGGDLPAPAAGRDTIRVVTFNVKYSLRVDEAIHLLRTDAALRDADILLLQEMDEPGVRAVADSLRMSWVYYPASRHPRTGRDFGNAVLARWPIADDRKIVLPHLARFRRSQRAAVGATVLVAGLPVRAYSVHLATVIGNGPTERREQLAAVLDDAAAFPAVVIAGDFNSETVPDYAAERGYAWPSRGLPHTNAWWTFDHVLLRGLALAGDGSIGVRDAAGASDHKPVWVVLTTKDAN
ncbi:MAG: endonuclease/exonuclease/phosphatase family protein [Acidimicrobiales bacterium]